MRRQTKIRTGAAVGIVAMTGAVGAYAGSRDEPPPPPRPAAESAGGAVDPAGIPDELEVLGPDGRPVVCPDGKKLKIKKKDLVAAPAVPGTAEWQEKTSKKDSEPTVFRCGAGDRPVRVPASWTK